MVIDLVHADLNDTGAKVAATHFINHSVWFQCDPLPFDNCRISVKKGEGHEAYLIGIAELFKANPEVE